MIKDTAKLSITIEREGDEFRSVIHGQAEDGPWEMWQSHWCKDATEAMRKASKLIADMPTDFLAAIKNRNPMRADHPKVKFAK